MIQYEYVPQGICPSLIKIVIDDASDTVQAIYTLGGCHGSTQVMNRLLKGRKVQECIQYLSGIQCGRRGTSCPDQIAKALESYLANNCKYI